MTPSYFLQAIHPLFCSDLLAPTGELTFLLQPGFSKFISMLLVSSIQRGPKCFFGLVRGSNLQVCVYTMRYKPAKGSLCVNGHQVHSLSIEDFKVRINWLMTFYEDPLS